MVHADNREPPPALQVVDDLLPRSFRDDYFRRRRPVLMTEHARRWPAFETWSLDYFLGLAQGERVAIEQGNVLQGATHFESIRLADYLREIQTMPTASDPGRQRYLSLFDVFARFPERRGDVDFSVLTDLTLPQFTQSYAWIGPAGTVTAYHVDWADNLLAQIVGRKRIWLVAPGDSAAMYPSRKFDFRSTLSQVDPLNSAAFPRFRTIQPIEVVLERGAAIFIPRGWWHRVESLTPSISVNTFAQDWVGLLRHELPARLQRWLHQRGLWQRGHCTCHLPNGEVKS